MKCRHFFERITYEMYLNNAFVSSGHYIAINIPNDIFQARCMRIRYRIRQYRMYNVFCFI